MSNNEALESAEAALRGANSKLRAAKNLRDDEVRAATREIHDRHKPAVTEATKNVVVATEAHNAAIVASKRDAGPEIGARYEEWSVPKRKSRFSWELEPANPTGRIAVVQQRTGESEFPANVRWSLPDMGGKFLRVLKKNGEPGLAFEQIGHGDWRPVKQP